MTPLSEQSNKKAGNVMEIKNKFGVKYFKGGYRELTIFLGMLQLRFSVPQVAAWWGNKILYSFGRGHK